MLYNIWQYYFCFLFDLYLTGVNINVTIITAPEGIPVNGSYNTFDYPILTSVSLMCIATLPGGSQVTATSYSWTATNCYNRTGGVQSPCFYNGGRTGNIITGDSLLAPDAGSVTCTATVAGVDFTSEPLTLRISGKTMQFVVFNDFYAHYSFVFSSK